ncbi:MAG: hypothetical protein ABIG93_05830 [archaeon]
MVMVTLDIPKDVNKGIEHFKVEYELRDKRDAIILLLKQCIAEQKCGSMEDMFKDVNKMKPVQVSPKDLVRMKREVYSQ